MSLGWPVFFQYIQYILQFKEKQWQRRLRPNCFAATQYLGPYARPTHAAESTLGPTPSAPKQWKSDVHV